VAADRGYTQVWFATGDDAVDSAAAAELGRIVPQCAAGG
jgi:hypothetical protein